MMKDEEKRNVGGRLVENRKGFRAADQAWCLTYRFAIVISYDRVIPRATDTRNTSSHARAGFDGSVQRESVSRLALQLLGEAVEASAAKQCQSLAEHWRREAK